MTTWTLWKALRWWKDRKTKPTNCEVDAPALPNRTSNIPVSEQEFKRRQTKFPLNIGEPKIAETCLHYGSLSKFDTFYEIDLENQTCSCSDFIELKNEQPRNHLGRWCRHLMRAMNEHGTFSELNEWQRAIISQEYGGPIDAYKFALYTAPDVLLILNEQSDWINILSRRRRKGERIYNATGSIGRHGWNIKEKRWSYGIGPTGAGELRKFLSLIEGFAPYSIEEKTDCR